jgi:CDP-4-dehydro-6-deoxyglucose reductase, E3
MLASVDKPRRSVEILSRTDLSPGVCDYRLRVRDGEPFAWAPGQYVELFAPQEPDEALPYSIASAPDPARPGELELAVGSGSGRELLAALPVGTDLMMSGPFGQLLWPPPKSSVAATAPTGHSVLMVSSGTGAAPLRALLQATLRTEDSHSVTLLCGFRSESDVLWRSEFEKLARDNPRFSYVLTLSQPSRTWSGRKGRVQEHAVELAQKLTRPTVFLCGSLAMVKDVQSLLEERASVPARDIFAEGY